MLIISFIYGANIAEKPWTNKRKEQIITSREQSPNYIYPFSNKKLDAFISASAVGIYGAVNGEEICTETNVLGTTFWV
jgi:NAD dependent epimerase/dehydratase family enzyme